MMRKVADKDGYIMVTWANNHYYDFVKNWVAHVEQLGITAFAVGAMDNQILAQLLKDGIPCFSMQSGLTANDYGWGSPTFHKMACTSSWTVLPPELIATKPFMLHMCCLA